MTDTDTQQKTLEDVRDLFLNKAYAVAESNNGAIEQRYGTAVTLITQALAIDDHVRREAREKFWQENSVANQSAVEADAAEVIDESTDVPAPKKDKKKKKAKKVEADES